MERQDIEIGIGLGTVEPFKQEENFGPRQELLNKKRNEYWKKSIMKPEEFIKTIYLGNRACKKIEIDGWNKLIKIQVDEISRIRDASGQWNYYNEENIKDGYLVFEEASFFSMNPQGYLPNDWIDIVSVIEHDQIFEFTLSAGFAGIIDGKGKNTEITLSIKAKYFYLEDPINPGIKICE